MPRKNGRTASKTAKGQQRLEEAERRTRDTASERAAKRIKLESVDRPVDTASSSSVSPSDAIAGCDAASAGNVVAGRNTVMSGRRVLMGRNDSARRRQNWRWKCEMWRRSRTAEESSDVLHL